jgi:hypothetical protein
VRRSSCLQRGIAVAGINSYEDSDLYLAPPPPLPDSDADLAADLLAADGEPGANATEPSSAPAAPPEPAPQVRQGLVGRGTIHGPPMQRLCVV